MDGVLCDFIGAFNAQTPEIRKKYNNNKDDVPGMFRNMKPLKGAIESFHKLSEDFDVFILSSAPPFPPEIIAPACPILLPGGAVIPAINPTIGFLIL